ncbi:restriction endonuclease subunit S [Companilactobacillus pabuli]|uniref:Restriction endonuclease subunit S n=1 Tax=Companilactobacillus pabuli TaxID=2714036 RepID=A0A7L7KYD9_9LACO|nr:restriction endonuclease subunit S [Companilactobacillus pabuli]QMT84499.1 restriction endonuclease subunit S [Companilactobacillus pabuli]
MNKKMVPEVRFKGFIDDWEQHEMKNVLKKQYNGQTPSRSKSSFWNGTIDWLTSGELNRSIVTRTNEKITSNGQKNANLKIIPKGTFVIAITGLEAVGTRGNCALLGIDTTLNQSCMALFTDEKKLSPKFLFQWYRKYGNEYGIRYTQGTKQQSYNAEIINKLPINLPTLKEQKVINLLLSKVDIAITLQQRQLDLYIKLKKGLLQKLFPKDGEKVPEVRFTDFHGDWEQHKFQEILDKNNGIRRGPFGSSLKKDLFVKNSDYVVYEQQNAIYNNFHTRYFITKEKFQELIKFELNPGDFIMSGAGTIGKIAKVPNDIKKGVFNQALIRFRINNSIMDGRFFLQWMRSEFMQRRLTSSNPGSAIVNLIPMSELKKWTVIVPKRDEQKVLGKILNKLDSTIALQHEQLDELKSLKKYLLQKLFI